MPFFIWFLCISVVSVFGKVLYQKTGDVSITGIFNRGFGNDCYGETERGLEEIVSAIWTIQALNNYHYIPGITLGLTVIDVCDDTEDRNVSDVNTTNIGYLTNISNGFMRNIQHIMNVDMLTNLTIQILINLQWMDVRTIISDSEAIINSFKERASQEAISVHDNHLIKDSHFGKEFWDSDNAKLSSVVVVIATFANILVLNKEIQKEDIQLIITPTDFVFDVGLLDLPKDTIVSLPSMESKAMLSGYLRHDDFFSPKPPKSPLFIGTAASVLKLFKPIKKKFEEECQKNFNPKPCASVSDFIDEIKGNKTGLLSQKSMKISPDDVEETLKVLKIEASSNDEMFLYIASVINSNASEDFAIFQIFNLITKKFQPVPIMINDYSFRTREVGHKLENKSDYFDENIKPARETSKVLSHSRDPVINLLEVLIKKPSKLLGNLTFDQKDDFNITNETSENHQVGWRFLTWVSINTCICFVGVTCTFSSVLFIIIKTRRNDFLDGSPVFTIILMISVILTYISSLPFHLDFNIGNEFICNYRKYAPPMLFSVLFSLLLSRSFVLAIIENGAEFSNHINGYLQSILSLFMIGVQVSIISQNYIFSKDNYELGCGDIYNKYNIIFTLVYDFLLLILLVCVSPFIMASKRKCKEGLLFSISVFFITVVWSAWISFYVLLSNEQKDAAVAFGLTSTATVLLLCVFIPQTYFLAVPMQDKTLCSLSSLDKHILGGISRADYKSSQTLDECGFGTITYNREIGLSNPNFSTIQTNEDNNPGTTQNKSIIETSPEVYQPN